MPAEARRAPRGGERRPEGQGRPPRREGQCLPSPSARASRWEMPRRGGPIVPGAVVGKGRAAAAPGGPRRDFGGPGRGGPRHQYGGLAAARRELGQGPRRFDRTPPPRPPVRPAKPAPPPPPLSKDALTGSVPLRTFGQLKQLWQARDDEPGEGAPPKPSTGRVESAGTGRAARSRVAEPRSRRPLKERADPGSAPYRLCSPGEGARMAGEGSEALRECRGRPRRARLRTRPRAPSPGGADRGSLPGSWAQASAAWDLRRRTRLHRGQLSPWSGGSIDYNPLKSALPSSSGCAAAGRRGPKEADSDAWYPSPGETC